MILIILPVRNEAETIEATAKTLIAWFTNFKQQFNILFIDDCSKDDSVKKIKAIGDKRIKVVTNPFDRGKGSTVKVGLVFSNMIYKMRPEDLIILLDGDGQIDPDNLITFFNIMKMYEADVVIGNKRHLFSSIKYSIKRMIVSLGYNLLIKLLFGIRYSDTQCGIKLFKKGVLDKVIRKVNCKGYAFDLELIVALQAMDFRIADAPVKIKSQINRGSVSLKNIYQTFIETIKIFIRKQRGFYSERIS